MLIIMSGRCQTECSFVFFRTSTLLIFSFLNSCLLQLKIILSVLLRVFGVGVEVVLFIWLWSVIAVYGRGLVFIVAGHISGRIAPKDRWSGRCMLVLRERSGLSICRYNTCVVRAELDVIAVVALG